MTGKISAIIVAAGQGTRLGANIPKAFVPLCGSPMFLYSLATFEQHISVSNIMLVVPEDKVVETIAMVKQTAPTKPIGVIKGGRERWHSVKNGVDATPHDTEWVLVHDAARPLVTPAVINSLLACTLHHKAAFTATRETDTIRHFTADHAGRTLDRNTVVRVGTPQLFHKATLQAAFGSAYTIVPPPTDEIAIMEHNNVTAGIAWGDPLNFKITTAEDLFIAEAIIEKMRNQKTY